jgi:hypothetical protein
MAMLVEAIFSWKNISEHKTSPLVTYLNYYLSFDVCACFRGWFRLSKKKLFYGCTYQKMLENKVVTFLKRIKMVVFFVCFFGSDLSKIDQT